MNEKTRTAKQNPLFVVTNKGKDVEDVQGIFDALVKKLGLEPALKMLQGLLDFMAQEVQNYATLKAVNDLLTWLMAELKKVVEKIDELSVPVIKKLQRFSTSF